MKKIDLGQLASIVGNVGVVVGIVFLAVELNQNQRILEQQLTLDQLTGRDAALQTYNGFRGQLLENPHLLPVWSKGMAGEPLTAEEQEQFGLLCANHIWSQVTLYARFSALRVAEEVAATVSVLKGNRSSDRYRECWEGTKSMIELRGYGALIEIVEQDD